MIGSDIPKVLTALKVPIERTDGNEVYAHCPRHLERLGRPDRNASWSINTSTGVHHCFSCGYSGNLVTLVIDTLELVNSWGLPDHDAARAWLAQAVEIDLNLVLDAAQRWRDEDYLSAPAPLAMDRARLAVYTDPPEWALEARGLTLAACQHYDVRWDQAHERWVIPLFLPDGKLLGWQEKGQRERYFKNRPTSMRKSTTLFGIDRHEGGGMVVVESPLDAVRLRSIGVHGGVATCGTSVSEAQFRLMRTADPLIIAMDNPHVDAAGLQAARNILKATRALAFECWFFAYHPHGPKDIGDATKKEILMGLSRARHCVRGTAAITGVT